MSLTSISLKSFDQNFDILRSLVPSIIIFKLIVLGFYLMKRKPLHTEIFLTILVLFLEIWTVGKKELELGEFSLGASYYSGIEMELLLGILIIAKINWMKSAVVIIISSFVGGFYLVGNNNYASNLLSSIMNSLTLSLVAFYYERNDRGLYLERCKLENSMLCYKDLIKEFLPNPVIITKGNDIVFENKEVFSTFDCISKEDLYEFLDKMFIEDVKYIKFKQNSTNNSVCYTEGSKEFEPLNKPLEQDIVMDTIKEEETNRFQNMSIADMLYNTSEFQRPDMPFFIQIRSFYENKKLNCTLRFDVKARNIIWEEKSAVMLIFSENRAYQKIKELKEIAYFKESMMATFSHNMRTPLNGIIGLLSESRGNTKTDKK